jgi:hypothetical protein
MLALLVVPVTCISDDLCAHKGITYVGVHGLVLRFESEYILRALTPSLSVGGVDVCKDMGNTVLELIDGIRVRIEITSTVGFPVEVLVSLKGVVAMDRDGKLDAVAMRFDHKLVKTIQDSVVVDRWRISLKTRETVDLSALSISGLTYQEKQLASSLK